METANVVWVSCAERRVIFFKFSRISNFWHAGTWETQLLCSDFPFLWMSSHLPTAALLCAPPGDEQCALGALPAPCLQQLANICFLEGARMVTT